MRYDGEFVIDKPKTYITLSNIEKQGFPFFCGEMCLEGEVDIKGDNPVLILNTKGINVVEIEIGGKAKTILTDNKLSLKGIEKGKHKIKIKLKNNLRNLLGPHHLGEGECIHVTPCEFFKEECVWNMNGPEWNDGYCFVETSLL